MKKIILKLFQEEAIDKLIRLFIFKWEEDSAQQVIKFGSPTGSGKTVMMAQLVKYLATDPRLTEANVAFIWASIGGSGDGDLASQSRRKFIEYYRGGGEIDVTSLEDITKEKVIEENEILFFNWSKIKTKDKNERLLRKGGENEITWDRMIEATQEAERNIVLIIDEAHTSADTTLAQKEIDLINPRIIIKVTATHKEQEGKPDVSIKYRDVVDAGLIRESIDTQTKEEIENAKEDLDKHILKKALEKREFLKKEYEENNISVNPLLMIQLPNDETVKDKVTKEDILKDFKKKKDIVLEYLSEIGIDDNKIGIWLSDEKNNLDNITRNNSEVDILLFKQAPATGWDCPRAQVLLMYREIKSPVFQVQLLGRILRTSEGKKYKNNFINHSYLYTTYKKNEVIESYKNYGFIGENTAELFDSNKKKEIKQFELETFVSQRTKYNDLGGTFQFTFLSTAKEKIPTRKELEEKKFFSDDRTILSLISDEKIRDLDGFRDRLKKEGHTSNVSMSESDVDKLYNRLCIHLLVIQAKDSKFSNVARSWGTLKMAIDAYVEDVTREKDKKKYYKYIVSDLVKDANSILLPIIEESLKRYAGIREVEEMVRDERKDNKKNVLIPLSNVKYSPIYKKIKSSKCAMEPCYITTGKGSDNERQFIDFLEGNDSVEWWYKNGDNGAEHFSVKRKDGKLFYPDWFVKTKNSMWILDTKSGFTAEGEHAKVRAEALEKWLKKNKEYKGGLVKPGNGLWKIAKNDSLDWVNLDLI